MALPRPVPLLLLCALSSACGGLFPSDVACTADVQPSVEFKVVDGQGVPHAARVTFTINGGPERQPECIGGQAPQGACSLWAAGQEETGLFAVTVASSQGTNPQTQRALISRDECHVRTQNMTFTLAD